MKGVDSIKRENKQKMWRCTKNRKESSLWAANVDRKKRKSCGIENWQKKKRNGELNERK